MIKKIKSEFYGFLNLSSPSVASVSVAYFAITGMDTAWATAWM